jgi:hypothetical protein
MKQADVTAWRRSSANSDNVFVFASGGWAFGDVPTTASRMPIIGDTKITSLPSSGGPLDNEDTKFGVEHRERDAYWTARTCGKGMIFNYAAAYLFAAQLRARDDPTLTLIPGVNVASPSPPPPAAPSKKAKKGAAADAAVAPFAVPSISASTLPLRPFTYNGERITEVGLCYGTFMTRRPDYHYMAIPRNGADGSTDPSNIPEGERTTSVGSGEQKGIQTVSCICEIGIVDDNKVNEFMVANFGQKPNLNTRDLEHVCNFGTHAILHHFDKQGNSSCSLLPHLSFRIPKR